MLEEYGWDLEVFMYEFSLDFSLVGEEECLIEELVELQDEIDHKHILVCVQGGVLEFKMLSVLPGQICQLESGILWVNYKFSDTAHDIIMPLLQMKLLLVVQQLILCNLPQ